MSIECGRTVDRPVALLAGVERLTMLSIAVTLEQRGFRVLLVEGFDQAARLVPAVSRALDLAILDRTHGDAPDSLLAALRLHAPAIRILSLVPGDRAYTEDPAFLAKPIDPLRLFSAAQSLLDLTPS